MRLTDELELFKLSQLLIDYYSELFMKIKENNMNKNNLHVLFALQLVGHPRDSKRISMLQNAGFQVGAIAFERRYHKGRIPNCSIKIVGVIDHGRYLKRIVKMLTVIPSVRRAIKSNDMVYASGVDMALLSFVSGLGLGRPLILEIGDVQEAQTATGLKGRLIRRVDKYIANSCQLLVASAREFIDSYYRQWIKATTPALIIENKLEPPNTTELDRMRETPRLKGVPLIDRPLRIGYFGILRWENSWQILKSLAKARPSDVEIVVAGIPMEPADLPRQVEDYPNIVYKGPYRSPDDLPSLYYGVDLIWATYPDIDHWNLRWARTNRFYESCFYQTPIISRFGCADAVEVQRYGIGLIIKDHNIDRIVNALSEITPDDLTTWQKNMIIVPPEVYLYTTETDDLGKALRDIARVQIGSDA